MKLYPRVSEQKQYAKWNRELPQWVHPAEVHIGPDNQPTREYWAWRSKLCNNPLPVRYPNGYYGRHECICAIYLNEKGQYEALSYIDARKKIYCKLYGEAARKEPKFKELQDKLARGINLLILDVDGPTYTEKFPFNQVKEGSIEVNKENIVALLHDKSQAFGHAYALSAYLLSKEKEWLV